MTFDKRVSKCQYISYQIIDLACFTEERRKHLLDKISDYDHTYSFLRARSQRYEGTGQWVAESAEFQGWYQGTRSTGLWYHGIRK